MEKPLNQQVVFITGAASGIGLACAYRFAQEGAAVIGFDISEGEPVSYTHLTLPTNREV